MGNSRAYEAARKARGLPTIPTEAKLFKYGTPADREAAHSLFCSATLDIRRKLAEAQRELETERGIPGWLEQLDKRHDRIMRADRLLAQIERDYQPMHYEMPDGRIIDAFAHPLYEATRAYRAILADEKRPPARPTRGRGRPVGGAATRSLANLVGLGLDADDARKLLRAIGYRFSTK